jgi:hypothetical protein
MDSVLAPAPSVRTAHERVVQVHATEKRVAPIDDDDLSVAPLIRAV